MFASLQQNLSCYLSAFKLIIFTFPQFRFPKYRNKQKERNFSEANPSWDDSLMGKAGVLKESFPTD
jgi:hypothetical protein